MARQTLGEETSAAKGNRLAGYLTIAFRWRVWALSQGFAVRKRPAKDEPREGTEQAVTEVLEEDGHDRRDAEGTRLDHCKARLHDYDFARAVVMERAAGSM